MLRVVRIPHWLQRLFPQWIWTGHSQSIYLTFDDGPHPQSTFRILQLLQSMGWQATFFVIGRHAERLPDLIHAIRVAGMQMGNHGYEHLHGWKTAVPQYFANYQRGKFISKSPLFRPPYGKMPIGMGSKIRKDGSQVIMWTVMPYDFSNRPISPNTWINQLSGGEIIALHDSPRGADYFEKVIWPLSQKLQMEGWTLGLLQ